VFNIGCGTGTSVRELWQRIAALAGVSVEPRRGPARAGDVRHSCAEIARARKLLGYSGTVSVDEGLRHTIAYFRDRVYAPMPLKRSRLIPVGSSIAAVLS